MKAIAIGDQHFKVDNIIEIEMFIDKIEKLVKLEMPDIIVILGDLLDTHEKIFTIALNKAYEFVRKMRDVAPTYVLVGNHDYIQNSQFLTENHWMNGMKEWDNTTIVDKVVLVEEFGAKVVLTPYVPNGRFEEALNTVDGWKDADCIFAHQEFAGCKMGAIISTDGDKWPEDYPRIISGHIHSRQIIQGNIYYCGSSIQIAFGESEDKVIPILNISRGTPYSLREVDLDLPRKRIIYMDMDNIDDFTPKETEDHLKITLTGSNEEFKLFKKSNKYKELINDGTKVVFKAKKEKMEEIEPSSSGFREILYNLVLGTKNSATMEFYELIMNNRKVEENDIIII